MLELDGGNDEAIAYLKSNYEKRRDWEKLIGVHQREIERIADADRARRSKFIEVAKLASEKLKKPAVSIELWQKVLEANPEHPEALGELEKLYEREKMWDKLADVCETQAAPVHRSRSKKVAMLQKLGILFTDRVKRRRRARPTAWRELLAVEPENKRAPGRAQEALPRAEELGRAREVLRRAEQVRRVHPRARAAGRDRGRREQGRAQQPHRRAVSRSARTRPIAPCAPTRRC